MPIDPKTGEQLPYAGEPGAAPDAPPRQQGPSPQDMEATFEELDQILGAAEGEAAPAPEGAPEETPPEGIPPEEGAAAEEDVTVIAETLGIDQAKARELWDAAQAMPATQDLTPEELANKLVDDFDLRMKLEKLSAGEMEQEEIDAMLPEAPPAAEEAPMLPPPAGQPPL